MMPPAPPAWFAVAVAPGPRAAPPATRKPTGPVIGRFSVANPGGTLIADLGAGGKQVFTFRGPHLALRSEGLDIDAASVRIVRTGRSISSGEAEGPVRIVLRRAGGTETLKCSRATWSGSVDSAKGVLVLHGPVQWVHTGDDVEGPAEFHGDSGKVTLRGGDEGPLIEIVGGGATATPKDPARKPAKAPEPTP
ncbi:MAG: hypothetical protein ACKO5K_07945 [Armatimonadota bacterium]